MPIRLPRRVSSPDPPSKPSSRGIRKGLAGNMPAASVCRMASSGSFQQSSQHQRPLLPLPKPDPPLLLLKGDELHVSPQGVARSCYQLHSHTPSWTIEERYNLTNSTKSFVVSSPFQGSNFTIDIQEMDTKLAGTGGTTWEASIAMALFFARHPEQLRGSVVELGSGVGLGGILLHHVAKQSFSSITLTDGNAQVLEQCRANIARHGSSLEVKKLEWNEILSSSGKDQPNYNTVLACDCAYRPQDVPGLGKTLKSLLLRNQEEEGNNPTNQIHLFGPYNRAAYHDVLQWMENDQDLNVKVEWIELKRLRLAATNEGSTNKDLQSRQWHSNTTSVLDATSVTQYPFGSHREELDRASQSTTKFLHVTASHKKQTEGRQSDHERHQDTSLSDID